MRRVGRLVVQRSNRISRGRFLRVAGASLAVGSGLSALACQPNTSPNQGGGGGSENSDEKVLNYFNWSDYLDPNTIPDFEKEFGVKVNESYFASPDEQLAKIQAAGGSEYDVTFPGDSTAETMIKSQLLRKLDMSKIPNFDNIGARYKGLPFDPDNEYTVPFTWGTTGILYNKREIGEISGWEAMWDPRFEGKIAMLDDMREVVGAALKLLGYSLNTKNLDQLEEAKQKLIEQKPLVRAYLADIQMRDALWDKDVLLGQCYSGTASTAIFEDKDLEYVIPEEGATRWTDNMAIPANAPHPEIAHQFINYILRPKVGASTTNYTRFASPNEAALPFIDEGIKNDPSTYPPPETFERLETIQDVGATTRDYQRVYTEVKSA